MVGEHEYTGMRRARVKVQAEAGEAVYHCMSRVVNGERLLDETAREVLRQQLWQIADFCGLTVVTYALLSNHFHILVRVPLKVPIPDEELLRRYQVLYPKPTRFQTARLQVVREQLISGGPEADVFRRRNLGLMNDVSQFMKLLKQRFTLWFNHTHNRFGTLWAERFKSVLVEPQDRVLQTMAAYIDLNAVRAGLVTDPKDYRFCGYAEAVAGNTAARAGLRSVIMGGSWSAAQSQYRRLLFGHGAQPSRTGQATVSPENFAKVMAEGGELAWPALLRCRIRYFTDGAVLGSRVYVTAQLARLRPHDPPVPIPLPSMGAENDWAILHPLRGRAIG